MATSTRTRRKTPAQPADSGATAPATLQTDTGAAGAAPVRQATAPPVASTSAAAAPAKKAAARKPVAAKKAAARKAAVKTAAAASAATKETADSRIAPKQPAVPSPPVKTPAARTPAPSKPAAKQAAAKQAAGKKPASRKPAAIKPATGQPAPAAAPDAVVDVLQGPLPVPLAELPVVAPAVAPEAAPASAPVSAAAQAPARQGRRRPAPRPDPQAQATAQAVLAVLAAPAALPLAPAPLAPDTPAHSPAPVPARAPDPIPAPIPTGPAHSQLVCAPGDQAQIAWVAGHACPAPLRQAAQRRCNAQGQLPPDDDAALPLLLRMAHEAGHDLRVDDAVWALLAAHRDARHRLSALEAVYPDGPASPALQQLLHVPLPLYQAEGALFAVVAGRSLLADERGLGKSVQAIAAAQLWRRHFGVQRVLVVCAPAQRVAWQRAWLRFAGMAAADVQVVDGGHHQRQAQWSASGGVRILSPEALQSGAAHLAHWSPDLVIVDEPQQLALHTDDWLALQAAPHALVLCGAPLADLPALMDTLVAWLDTARLGPLAALRELHAAGRDGLALDEADIERLTAALSRLMLQRLRADVADQLPAVVHSERLLPLAPGQRQVHDQHAAVLQRLLAGWQASGWCSDSDQWRLAQALRAMQQACHRADPADAGSALAETTVQALAGALADLAGTGAQRVVVLCPAAADAAQLGQRLGLAAGVQPGEDAAVLLLSPGDPLPAGVDVVLQVGVPWRPRRHAAGPRGEAPAGQQWLYLVAQDSIECGLFDTLAGRMDAPRSPADGAARGYLQGDALALWLQMLQAASAATPTSPT